jgi:selenocysteine-specific translation elongation factor
MGDSIKPWTKKRDLAKVFSTWRAAHDAIDLLGVQDIGVVLTKHLNEDSSSQMSLEEKQDEIDEDIKIELVDLGLADTHLTIAAAESKYKRGIDYIKSELEKEVLHSDS